MLFDIKFSLLEYVIQKKKNENKNVRRVHNFAKCKNDYHTRFRLGKIPISAVLAVPIGNQKIV